MWKKIYFDSINSNIVIHRFRDSIMEHSDGICQLKNARIEVEIINNLLMC